MNSSELAELRRALVARLSTLTRRARGGNAEPAHVDVQDESEDAVLDELDALAGELGDRDAHEADQIVAAIDRMGAGEYGLCVDCGKPIPVARLRAIPWAERCAEDQSAVDGVQPHLTL
jgi:DnaK suppressor protein